MTDVGVMGVPQPARGQNARAVIVLREGYEPTEALAQGIIDFCRGRIAVYKLPPEVECVDELPRTATGRLSRRILRKGERETG